MKINNADKWFSRFIRLRDSDDNGYCTCITCGNIRYWKNLDCGHWIKRQHMATRYNEMNCAPQCKKCNAFEQGRDADFEKYVIAKYGQQNSDLLKSGERICCKHSKLEIDIISKKYQKLALELAETKGITI